MEDSRCRGFATSPAMPCTLNNHLQQLWLEDWTQSRRGSRVVRGHGTDRGGSQDIVATLASVKFSRKSEERKRTSAKIGN